VLEKLSLYDHEMDMGIVEQGRWVCHDLKTIRIRVKGLDTKKTIVNVVALWCKGCWRRRQDNAGIPVVTEGKDDLLVEARVARHFLMFRQAEVGYQTWTPL
jgi:hypothetical protein